MKKVIAVFLIISFAFLSVFPVNAIEIIGELETGISGMDRLTVSAALNDYFDSRESFLLGEGDTLNVLLQGIEDDETVHRQMYDSQSLIYLGSAITIGDITFNDIQADAEVTETVSYVDDGVSKTATVEHDLFLALNDDNAPVVVYDGYYEMFSDFRSSAYVDEESVDVMSPRVGSGNCLVHVAETQVGYAEAADGYTKYGDWYDQEYNTTGFAKAHWCVMFVSWCAAQALIPETIIYKIANETTLKDFYINQGRYYSRSQATGTLSPQAGDIVFFANDHVKESHVGIVRYADSSNIYVVHGNAANDDVSLDTFSRTNPYVLGYAKPAYDATGHSSNSGYVHDGDEHWLNCCVCGCEYNKETHILPEFFEDNEVQHWKACETCDREVIREAHTFIEVLSGRVYICSECGYEKYQ